MPNFKKVNPKQSFPKLEEEILKFWKENKTFEKSIETRKNSEEFNFYDGPPFATGTPHYGHILAGTIKDVIPRYQTMLGKKVDRVFGWDCHGLPIENIVEKKMGINGKEDIECNVGVFDFNENCRANVFGFVDEWKKTVNRMGRWVDMENDYKTMDTSFMESVWWVFKSIYDKGLIYEGHRVVPYCPRCSTPLSNFEVNQGYKDVQNKTVTVKFRVKNGKQEVCYRDSTGIVVKNTKGQILLGKKKSNGLFSFPGGKNENCETPINCIRRELLEETGLELNEEKLYSCNTSLSNGQNWKEHVYEMILDDESLVKNPEKDKYEHWKFYDINDELLVEKNFEVHSYNVFKQVKGEKQTQCYHTTGNKYILAWTTTPWTLYANLGLAVGADIDYVELLDKTNGDTYILAKEKVKDYFNPGVKNKTPGLEPETESYIILREYKGECLVGIKYEPIFSDFDIQLNEMNADLGTSIRLGSNAWTVRIGHHVTTDTGTGVVHIAPAYGEDDYLIGQKDDLGFVAHIDSNGKTYNLLENNGKFVFDFNEMVIEELKAKKLSVNIGTIMHSYPYCWRCDTPLIYRAISAWYVAVEKIRDKMVENNKKITWVPEAIKYGRFGNWIEQARDWNISRNRYWGSAIPVWQSYDKKEEICIGSIEELYELNKDFGQIEKKDGKYFYSNSGKEIDLHKHFVDEIFIKNDKNFKAKKVLGIHGFLRTKDGIGFFEKTKENLEKEGIIMNAPIFEEGPNINYKNWEKKLDELNLKNYDTIITHSMGGRVAIEYIIENKINLNRLVMVAPGIEGAGTKEVSEFYSDMKQNFEELKKYVKEIIILVSKDDKVIRVEQGQKLSNIIGANLVEVNGYGHFNVKECSLIEGLIKYGAPLKRIPEVLDCWFESGAMPYRKISNYKLTNYKLDEKEKLKEGELILTQDGKIFKSENGQLIADDSFKFPADFIAEGLDQTRGWFYTLLILGTALFDNTPFLNCIVNGVVLAEDGKKMSKSLQNYPAPELIFDKYGADAMRFYLMNSPVVEAQDFRFAETGVEEIVKKVILPLWNTYSFFTTYANIDDYKPQKGAIYFCRHGQTTNNEFELKNGGDIMMSGGDSEAMLTEKGKKQAKNAGMNFNFSGEKIDLIISSPRQRAQDTASIIAKEIGYKEDIIIDERFNEIREGVFLNMTHSEIQSYAKKEYNIDLKPGFETRKFFKNGKYNKVEDVALFDKRVIEAYKEIEEKYSGKNILIIAHTGVFRPINRYINNIDFEDAHFKLGSIQNASIFKMPKPRNNVLDKWIISELNKLISDIKTGLDNYKINDSTRPVSSFMDNLTNWYIRRSRKRFWGEGMEKDKIEAYDTLYEVLIELCKILAPFMPFVSEYIYKNLTGKESVHLQNFPNVNKSFILNDLNDSFEKTSKLVNLGLAFRSRHKLRVRQVLKSATIGEKLEDYYLEILKEELNVKEIIVLEDSSKIAKKICRPYAKLIGPKYGKDVQKIIIEAKNGNFEELEDGKIKVGEFILEVGEYEIAYEKLDENMDIEAGFGMVIAIDPSLTEELISEGYARDLVRYIQEARKEAKFEVSDRINLELKTESLEIKKSIENFKKYIEEETLSTIIEKIENGDFYKEIEIDDFKVKITLKKV